MDVVKNMNQLDKLVYFRLKHVASLQIITVTRHKKHNLAMNITFVGHVSSFPSSQGTTSKYLEAINVCNQITIDFLRGT